MGIVLAILNVLATWIFGFIAFMIKSLYNLILLLADINLLENSAFDNMKNNVFGLIGLFMLFKLTFSVIQYITNPDKLTDQSTGAGKILTKVVVVLILLGTVNKIFSTAFELQGLILEDAVLERLIFGIDHTDSELGNEESNTIDPKIVGEVRTSTYLSYSILAPFVNFNTEADIWGDEADTSTCTEFISATDPSIEDVCGMVSSDCYEKMLEWDPDKTKIMCQGLKERDIYKTLSNVAMMHIDKTNVLSIDGFFGLVVGAVSIVVLTIIAVGVAIRSVKLSFLNLIAPIPIITYIEPKENSNSMFNKWAKETIKTFLELFIRLLSFYFAILVITKVLTYEGGVPGYSGKIYKFVDHPLVIIFLIIGCFLFALQLPKLIENLFGSMGGFSKDAKSTGALAAGVAGIAGGVIGGGISNAIGTAKNIKDANNGRLGFGGAIRTGLASVTGAVGTGFRSLSGTAKGFKNSGGNLAGAKWNDIASNAIARTGQIRNARAVTYTTAGGRNRSAYPAFSPIKRTYGRFASMAGIKDEYSASGRIKGDIKNLENQIRTKQTQISQSSSDRMAALQQYNSAKHEHEMLKNNAPAMDTSMFNDLGGTFDSTNNDYMFELEGGIKRALKDMSYNDYHSLYTSKRKDYQNFLNASGLSQAEKDQKLSDFARKFDIANQSTFAVERNRIEDTISKYNEYNTRLTNAAREEMHWASEYQTQNTTYNTYQQQLTQMNKDLATLNKQSETVNKAVNKK